MSTAPPPSAPPAAAGSSVSPRLVFAGGMGLILLIIGLLAWMVTALGGRLAPAHWSLLYVGIALVTGIAFWTLTTSTGEVTLTREQVALKLGGGAAIGAAFMYMAYWFNSGGDPYVVVPLASSGTSANAVAISDFDRGNLDPPYLIRELRQVLVEFKEGKKDGWYTTKHPEPPNKMVYLTYHVTRLGMVGKEPDRKEVTVQGTNP
jgi:hypothetical protein